MLFLFGRSGLCDLVVGFFFVGVWVSFLGVVGGYSGV